MLLTFPRAAAYRNTTKLILTIMLTRFACIFANQNLGLTAKILHLPSKTIAKANKKDPVVRIIIINNIAMPIFKAI